MPDVPTLPSAEELLAIPRHAVLAFAARCARRVHPLFYAMWPDAPLEHLVSVENAIEAAENSSSEVAADQAEVASHAAGNASDARAVARTVALAAMYAARTAVHADDAIRRSKEAAMAADAATHAVGAGNYRPDHSDQIKKVTRMDFELLREAAEQEKWTDETSVIPVILGPQWPGGPPPEWPDQESNSENAELLLTIDVPEGFSDNDVLKLVAGLVERVDAVHRAYGGHGLQVEEGNVKIDRQVLEPVPAGGGS